VFERPIGGFRVGVGLAGDGQVGNDRDLGLSDGRSLVRRRPVGEGDDRLELLEVAGLNHAVGLVDNEKLDLADGLGDRLVLLRGGEATARQRSRLPGSSRTFYTHLADQVPESTGRCNENIDATL
jgi:hypothetical protein